MFPGLTAKVLVTAMAAFFLMALLSGVWKYRWMMRAPTHQAPIYVDIAHRASFQYAFACLLLLSLNALCVWPEWLRLAAVAVLLLFFFVSVFTYIALGLSRKTDNQFQARNFTTTHGMTLLIVGEISGFLILASGALVGIWQR